jgi:hypothetical protein
MNKMLQRGYLLFLEIRNDIARWHVFVMALVLFAICIVSSYASYHGYENWSQLAPYSWLSSMAFLCFAYCPKLKVLFNSICSIKRNDWIVALFIFLIYFCSHFYNFSGAPWNQFGLFDDAAWDIYFANNHVFHGETFHPAYFDEVGYISREVLFHFYIKTLFLWFGHSLGVFNISLILLGYVTVFFVTFVIHRLFDNLLVTIISAIVINFYPLHFMHIFMGHRYAIAAPMMMISYYYLVTAFQSKSSFRIIISGTFAAFCVASSVMGKQYLLSLLLSVVFLVLFRFFYEKKSVTIKESALAVEFVFAFFIGLAPLIVYVTNYGELYYLREQGLAKEFFDSYNAKGFDGIKPYIQSIYDVYFADYTGGRQFLPDYLPIPIAYYFLLVPGLIIALIKRRYDILFLSIIPTAGTLIARCYDFRVLLSVPAWVIAISYTLNAATKPIYQLKSYNNLKDVVCRFAKFGFVIILLLLGLIPSVKYIFQVAHDPNHLWLLPHKDVAFSRVVQDLAIGRYPPSIEMKHDELMPQSKQVNDLLVCPEGGYAITHLYLQQFKDKNILSFCDNVPQTLLEPVKIRELNYRSIEQYQPQGRNLLLVWQLTDKVKAIINEIKSRVEIGKSEVLNYRVDGQEISIYVLTIQSADIYAFKKAVSKLDKE